MTSWDGARAIIYFFSLFPALPLMALAASPVRCSWTTFGDAGGFASHDQPDVGDRRLASGRWVADVRSPRRCGGFVMSAVINALNNASASKRPLWLGCSHTVS
jgi:hypothetical protein